ncbi:diguanylate cyclase domain-containing protein [Eubacterium limosum]|uniref:diguanylate cyclase domain-containing protein n=1 Tax=Eubacterium limosum TaxID=1736 RepID=UPI0010634079|nr:diguanylate cyclase [Eubacterium limosum]
MNTRNEALLDKVPGAVLQCKNNESYEILAVNQCFLDMFGYSREALRDEFQNQFVKMLYEPDSSPFHQEQEAGQDQTGKINFQCGVRCRDGRYKWVTGCRHQSVGENGEAQIFCVMLDNDENRQMVATLRQKAEQDALTGLYNREAIRQKISAYLSQEPGSSALFLIDTDNFKQVNDNMGHLFGDAVLTEMAIGMKKLVRQSDVVGRIGGDEFIIFLKDLTSQGVAEEKARQLLDTFQHLFQSEKRPIEVTCSIGVALCPQDGQDFQTLYQNADRALYQAKSIGKNNYKLFDQETMTSVAGTGYSTLGSAIDSNREAGAEMDNLATYVFQILYNAKDLDNAIQTTLEIVGKRFDVSRAYIFENSEDGRYCDNTYEWCNAGIEPQKDYLQHYAYEDFGNYAALFEENALFYCRDIYSLVPEQVALFEEQGIRSTLQCAIQDNGAFSGFVGFDECTGTRMWTKEEIGMLSLISQLLTVFLQKKRAAERDRQLAVRLNTILDTQDAYICAIQRDNYELLYINHKTRELDPGAVPGQACYEAFFHRDSPCERCPLRGNVDEVYNPRYQMWTRVRCSPIKWGDHDAYLLTCFDITEYKKM